MSTIQKKKNKKRTKKISDCYRLESFVKITVYNLRNDTTQWQHSKSTKVCKHIFCASSYSFRNIAIF